MKKRGKDSKRKYIDTVPTDFTCRGAEIKLCADNTLLKYRGVKE